MNPINFNFEGLDDLNLPILDDYFEGQERISETENNNSVQGTPTSNEMSGYIEKQVVYKQFEQSSDSLPVMTPERNSNNNPLLLPKSVVDLQKIYENSLNLDPNNIEALMNLGELYLHNPGISPLNLLKATTASTLALRYPFILTLRSETLARVVPS